MSLVSKPVSQFHSKKGNEIVFRYPLLSDGEKLTDYINTLSCENTFITFQGEQLTLAEEKETIEKWVDAINAKKSVVLLAFHKDSLVAVADIQSGIRTSKHVGTMGISIAKGYRDEGIGTALIEQLVLLAKEIQIRMIELYVFANNEKAQHVYRKIGFEDVGRIPERVLYKGEYLDEIIMVKKLT